MPHRTEENTLSDCYRIQLRSSQMKEMHRARHGGVREHGASRPSVGTPPPTSTCSPIQKLFRSHFIIQSLTPHLSPPQSSGWGETQSSYPLITCFVFFFPWWSAPILRLSGKPTLSHFTSKDSGMFQRAWLWQNDKRPPTTQENPRAWEALGQEHVSKTKYVF